MLNRRLEWNFMKLEWSLATCCPKTCYRGRQSLTVLRACLAMPRQWLWQDMFCRCSVACASHDTSPCFFQVDTFRKMFGPFPRPFFMQRRSLPKAVVCWLAPLLFTGVGCVGQDPDRCGWLLRSCRGRGLPLARWRTRDPSARSGRGCEGFQVEASRRVCVPVWSFYAVLGEGS